jgi:two-component system, NtrC family, response regulator HydG
MKDKPRILVVDDEAGIRMMLRAVLEEEGYEIFEAADGPEAIRAVERDPLDLVLLDIRMTRMDGIETLAEIRKISPLIPVLMMTAYATVKTAVEALKAGAFEYLAKPLDIEELKILVQKALEYYRLREENLTLKERLGARFDFSRIVGRGRKMSELFDFLAQIAPSEATVLILGESGTGKEIVANALHQNSPRAQQPFVKVACAALPETLLESELFGHEKGAFTGAVARREGRFQAAHRGTIFLDEVGEMSPAIQTKLLRVLQEREFEPVGSLRTVKVNVRVIAATNKELDREVKEGRFREDLYYRLNVIPVHLPPLRERKEDIPALAHHFLTFYGERNKKEIREISPKALDLLVRYDWPGNIRELENCLERAVIVSRGEAIAPLDLPPAIRNLSVEKESSEIPFPAGLSLQDAEKALIFKTLEDAGGNRSRAAEILGINRRTLQMKLKEYGI